MWLSEGRHFSQVLAGLQSSQGKWGKDLIPCSESMVIAGLKVSLVIGQFLHVGLSVRKSQHGSWLVSGRGSKTVRDGKQDRSHRIFLN